MNNQLVDVRDPGGKRCLKVPENVVSRAFYSPCRQYRYMLRYDWDPDAERRSIMFLMLNPSTEDVTDPTVMKCRAYASQWDYNTLLIGNLMAYRATDPCLLRGVDDPVGPKNAHHLQSMLTAAHRLVCAWGRLPQRLHYVEQAVVGLIEHLHIQPYVLRLNSSGGPGHPLYLPIAIEPQEWSAF